MADDLLNRLTRLERLLRAGFTTAKLVITGTLTLSNGAVTSGTYTPTLTNDTNVDASTAEQLQYLRVGNMVTVSGRCQVNATAAASTILGISLPIASNIGAVMDIGGVIVRGAGGVGEIRGNSTNDTAEAMWVATLTTNTAYYIHFTYRII